ncbi:hypothetical protein, partial [Oscillatoria sp. HE19RPO]|uniref:hypothetical protein n=1 Tax=Oscillatoria sp. HE19RPO TaxID=2954806 RepID=UPI0020C1BA3D
VVMSTPDQLSLFDLKKYSTPSRDGKPDWYYDTHDGVEDEPSVSKKKGVAHLWYDREVVRTPREYDLS